MTESIIQWNMRGFIGQLEGLRRIISEYRPFGVCLQETKLRPGQMPRVHGYVTYSKELQPAPGGRAHGGVAVCVRDNVSSKRLPLNTNLQAVAVRIAAPMQITLACIYLPDIHWRRSDIESLLLQLPSPVLLLGDFNSHNSWWGSATTDARGWALEEIIDNANLMLLNNGAATHFNAYSGTFSAIDLSIASPTLAAQLEWAPMNEMYQSDHYPLIIKSNISRPDYIIPAKYNLKRANWPVFSANVLMPPLSGDVNTDVQLFTNEMRRAAERSVPLTGGKLLKPPAPWWTPECKAANAEKKRALNRLKRYPTEENLTTFKIKRARERRIIRKSKKETLASYISTITTTTTQREVWNKIRALSGGRKLAMVPVLRVNTVIITEPRDVAECLARHYSQVSGTSSYSVQFLRRKSNVELQPLDFNTVTEEAYNTPLTIEELNDVLKKVRNSSPGVDNIPYAMIRNLPESGKIHLLEIYNRIWETGEYPESWREALIVPIPKEGKDPSDPSSYRPISLTTCLSKVLETIVNKRLVYVLEKRGLYSQHQAGFRKCHSTMDQLSRLEMYVQDAFMRREHVLAVFFDLEKAFDTAWRFGILRKCHEWGLRGNLPRFIQSFLESRRFRVRLGSIISDPYPQENGIPQGSVLSVTLFAVAVNNLADAVADPIEKSLYVDDLAIYLSGRNLDEVGNCLQQAIDRVAAEADGNGFKFSQTKTACIHFCRLRTEHSAPVLNLNGIHLEYKDYVRFLGLYFDSKLYWQKHFDQLSNTCKKSIEILKFLSSYRWSCDREILLKIFISLTRSRLEYGAPVYSSARKTRLKRLDYIYNQALRLITGAFRTSPLESLYVESGMLPPVLRREQLILNYAAGMWGKPHHCAFPALFESQYQEEFRRQRTRTRPLGVRIRELMTAERLEFGPVEIWAVPNTPPWLLPSANVCMDLATHKKDETPPFVYRTKLLEIYNRYKGFRPIFTDGSKTSEGVGSAVYAEGVTKAWTLPQYSSIYTAELYAIRQALQYCLDEANKQFLILTDSLSALMALGDKFSPDPYIIQIYEELEQLRNQGKRVVFIWVPGHIGVSGNERADEAAKRAALAVPDETIPVRPTDFKAYIKEIMLDKWQARWDATENKLKCIQPCVRGRRVESFPRREEVILTRLRIGHTRITHGHLLVGNRRPRCPLCGERLTVSHFLEECQEMERYRQRAGLTRELRATLKIGPSQKQALFLFLQDIGLYFRI